MTWSIRVRVESQKLSSHFESSVCKHESMSKHMKFNIFLMFYFCYEMAPNMLLLRSESLSGKHLKLRTVAASNNRDHMPQSLSTYASHYIQSFTS